MMRHGVGWGSSVGAWMSSKPSIGVIPEAGGLEALVDRPRGPAPACLPDWVEQAVIVVRLLTYWNSKRLAAEFTRREIFPLDHHAVDHLLGDLGTARPSTRERGPAYERGRPNELWHIDIKGPFFLRRSAHEYEKTWIVGLVDDHSRFLIGLRILPRPQGRTHPRLARRLFRAVRDAARAQAAAGLFECHAAANVAPDLFAIRVPTLIIHGELDAIIPLADAEMAARAIPDSKLVVIPGADHVPTMTRPEEVVAAINDWRALTSGREGQSRPALTSSAGQCRMLVPRGAARTPATRRLRARGAHARRARHQGATGRHERVRPHPAAGQVEHAFAQFGRWQRLSRCYTTRPRGASLMSGQQRD